MGTPAVRAAREEDVPALAALYLDYIRELRGYGLQYEANEAALPEVAAARVKSRLFFAGVLDDGAPRGFVFCSVLRVGREFLAAGDGRVGYLNDLYVVPALRGGGYARALARAAEDWLRESGVGLLELQVLRENAAGRGFWRAQGFCETGVFCCKEIKTPEGSEHGHRG